MKKSIFLSVIGTLYKKAETDVTDDLKTVEGDEVPDETVAKIFEKFDAEKVSGFKDTAKERFDHGVKKGTLETAKKFEKGLKTTFEIEDDLESDELLSKVAELYAERPKDGGKDSKVDFTKVTPEDLDKIPAFINRKREFETKLKEKDTEKETAIKEIESKSKKEALSSEAIEFAYGRLSSKNPVLPTDEKKASNMKATLLGNHIKGLNLMRGDDKKIILLDDEGKPKENANGHTIEFESYVDEYIDGTFEFKEGKKEPKSPQNKNRSESDDKTKYTGTAPTSNKEYLELLTSKDLTSEEKSDIRDTYGEQFRG